MNIHDQIKNILASGQHVYSNAWGRVGEIVSVDDHPSGFTVNICPKSREWNQYVRHTHQHGATTFLHGDKVELVYRDGVWYVVNVFVKEGVFDQ